MYTSTTQEEIIMGELTFPFKFTHTLDKTLVYTCSQYLNYFTVYWTDQLDGVPRMERYEKDEVYKMVFEGFWNIIPEPPTTQSELDYISELESRITELEELCSDYSKIVTEKDNEITRLTNILNKVWDDGYK